VTYCVQLPVQWKIHNTFHATLLYPHKVMELYGETFTEPPPDLIIGQEEWEVKNILALRQQGRWKKLQYLVSWAGFLEVHNSWEPPGNLSNAHEAIIDFHHIHPQAIQYIIIKEEAMMKWSSPSYSPIPNLEELIISFDKLCISMPSCNSSTENLVDHILNQPWRSPTNLVTGEAIPYCMNNYASPTTSPNCHDS
jgi:Chromo (CHRromatin Organisation MOdifier) domain